ETSMERRNGSFKTDSQLVVGKGVRQETHFVTEMPSPPIAAPSLLSGRRPHLVGAAPSTLLAVGERYRGGGALSSRVFFGLLPSPLAARNKENLCTEILRQHSSDPSIKRSH